MKHDPLKDALRSLPRQGASMGFTRRVIESLDEEPRRRTPLVPGWALAAAAVTALVVAAVPFLSPSRGAGKSADRDVERLYQERQRVLSEIESLRQRAAEPLPVVYLGGDDSVDLVLDLDDLLRRRQVAGAQPAVYRPGGSY